MKVKKTLCGKEVCVNYYVCSNCGTWCKLSHNCSRCARFYTSLFPLFPKKTYKNLKNFIEREMYETTNESD